MFKRLLITPKNSLDFVRNYGKHNKKYLYKDGRKYGNVIYYPRDPSYVDPPVEPSKLFRVQRIKPVKGNPYWEKAILTELGLDGKASDYAVVKNIPENNARLLKVKHLVKVTPIHFPYGEPTEDDIKHTILMPNGQCIVAKQIHVREERIEAFEKFSNDSRRLDGETMRKDLRLKWLNPW